MALAAGSVVLAALSGLVIYRRVLQRQRSKRRYALVQNAMYEPADDASPAAGDGTEAPSIVTAEQFEAMASRLVAELDMVEAESQRLVVPRELPPQSLKMVARIGEGSFGLVHKAVYDGGDGLKLRCAPRGAARPSDRMKISTHWGAGFWWRSRR